MSLGDPVLRWLTLTQTYLGLCVVPQPTLRVSCEQYHRIALMVCRRGWGYPDRRSRLQTVHNSVQSRVPRPFVDPLRSLLD